nr:uncharacterized protein LOC117279935 [Nicotiana tomentosiformis]
MAVCSSLVNIKKKLTKSFRKYIVEWKEHAARVKPPMKETEMNAYFLKPQEPDYFHYMLAAIESWRNSVIIPATTNVGCLNSLRTITTPSKPNYFVPHSANIHLTILRNVITTMEATGESTAQDFDKIKAARKKHEDNEVQCRCFILNLLSDRLYDLFRPIKSPQEIWKVLEHKYTTMKQGTYRFLSMNFYEFQMVDEKSVMEQVDELFVLISRLKDFKVDIFKSLTFLLRL